MALAAAGGGDRTLSDASLPFHSNFADRETSQQKHYVGAISSHAIVPVRGLRAAEATGPEDDMTRLLLWRPAAQSVSAAIGAVPETDMSESVAIVHKANNRRGGAKGGDVGRAPLRLAPISVPRNNTK